MEGRYNVCFVDVVNKWYEIFTVVEKEKVVLYVVSINNLTLFHSRIGSKEWRLMVVKSMHGTFYITCTLIKLLSESRSVWAESGLMFRR